MTGLRAGGLFSGTGALDMAVAGVFGAQHAWFAEHESATAKNPRPRNAGARVLAYRWPGVPNLGDVAAIDWAATDPADILVAGYPCQPESDAGKRLGQSDDRWLWPHYLTAIRTMRPRWAVGENVRGHIGRGLRHVVADLQDAGYAVAWVTLRAADIGACHGRARVFWLAWPEESGAPAWAARQPFAHLHDGAWGVDDLFGVTSVGEWPYQGAAYQGAAYQGAAYQGAAPAPSLLPTPVARDGKGASQRHDTTCLPGAVDELHLLKTPTAQLAVNGGSQHPAKRRAGGHGPTLADQIEHLLPTPVVADAERASVAYARGNPTLSGALLPTVTVTATDAAGGRNATAGRSNPGSQHHGGTTLTDAVWQPERWGKYAAAIARHETALGRPAPDPTGPYGRNGDQRLSHHFTEWMMMFDAGWITGVPGITRNDTIRLCGNGVVQPQATAALTYLVSVAALAAAA